jgi:hypothetical protein
MTSKLNSELDAWFNKIKNKVDYLNKKSCQTNLLFLNLSTRALLATTITIISYD